MPGAALLHRLAHEATVDNGSRIGRGRVSQWITRGNVAPASPSAIAQG